MNSAAVEGCDVVRGRSFGEVVPSVRLFGGQKPDKQGSAFWMDPRNEARMGDALATLRDDRLVAFPTETVWGLAALARSPRAMERLRRWKGRDAQQPVSVLVSGKAALDSLGIETTPLVARLIERFWPGPLTLVLPSAADWAPGVPRADGAVGVRCSPHPLAAELVSRAERAGLGPLTATSLNRSGEVPARHVEEARALCVGSADPALLEQPGLDASDGAPSSVLDLVAEPPRLLRTGAIGLTDLAQCGLQVDGALIS